MYNDAAQPPDLILRRPRSGRLEGWQQARPFPSFETPAFGRLLRVKSGGVQTNRVQE